MIRFRIRKSVVRSRECGSVLKCHGYTTLVIPVSSDHRHAVHDDDRSTKNLDPDPIPEVSCMDPRIRIRTTGGTVPVSADHRNAVHDDDRVHAVRLLRLHLHDVRHQLLNPTQILSFSFFVIFCVKKFKYKYVFFRQNFSTCAVLIWAPE